MEPFEAIWIKEETYETHTEPDSVVPASTTYDSGNTRLRKNNTECCSISFKETVNQGVVNNGLDKDAEESTHSFMFGTGTQGLTSQEEVSVGDQGLSTDNKEKSHCTNKHTNIRLCEDDVEVSFVEETERQSSSQNAFVASQKYFNVMVNTQTALHNAITSNGSAQAVSLTKIRPYKCDVCGKCFTQLGALKRHSLIHSGIKPHKCDTCGKSFTQSGDLKKHGLIHSGIKSHKCDTCGKSFTHLDQLKTHTLIHYGIKPHKCDTCGKSFTLLGDLKKHSLIHSGIKPHKCDTCGSSFTQLTHLKCHVLIHSGIKPHKCDTCGKCFTEVGTLRKHALIHYGIKPHKCGTCGKCFTKLGGLKKHTLTHSGIKPHKCDTCGKSYSDSGNLKKHALIHSTVNPKCY